MTRYPDAHAMMRLRRREFARIVQRAVTSLPEPVREWLENVDVLVRDRPSREELRDAGLESPYDLLGLYQGLSRGEQGSHDMVLPGTITLFRQPILAVCRTAAEVEAEVRTTLLHEIAHYLGWGEEEMSRLGVE